jgi:short chain dehydrogenase/Aldo/keto reductase family
LICSARSQLRSRRRPQITLAWLLAQKPWIVPIPGTTKLHRLEENIGAAGVGLTPDDLRDIDRAVSKVTVHGTPRTPRADERSVNGRRGKQESRWWTTTSKEKPSSLRARAAGWARRPPGFAVYAATKHAVRALSEGLRHEVKPYNIRTTVILPGAVATELPQSVTAPEAAERTRKFYAEIAIPAESFARAVAFAMSQPEDVDVNEILFQPTRQEL